MKYFAKLFVFSLAMLSIASQASLRPAAGFYNNADGSPVVALIDQAKETLDMEIYEMDDPAVISAIRRAFARNVRVQIVKEETPVGASCRVFEAAKLSPAGKGGSASCDDQRKLVDEVIQAGGSYVPFKTPDLCGANDGKSCLEHGKIMIADSTLALITSGNFNATNLCDIAASPKTCNRDFSFVTQDADIVTTLEKVVAKDLLGRSYDVSSVVSTRAAAKMTVGPDSMNPIIAFIGTARKSLLIENQYLKDPTMNAAILAAASRGVHVEVTVASACSFGKPRPTEAKQLTDIFTEFDNAGISTTMFTKKIKVNGIAGYLHAKAMVVDGKHAWMGSVNGSTQALTRNREFGVFFDTSADVGELAKILTADHADANGESWQDSLNCGEDR